MNKEEIIKKLVEFRRNELREIERYLNNDILLQKLDRVMDFIDSINKGEY